MADEFQEMLTVNEVAKYLRMNPMTIYRLAQQGQIPASKIRGYWRFNRQDIEKWVKSQEFQPSKILVVDDDPEIGASIKTALEKKHTVVSVENGNEAIQALHQEKYNLIFLDIGLPDIDGITLYKQIKNRLENTPVVVVTNSMDVVLLTQILSEGAKFVLNKPFTIDEVRQMLNFIKV